MTGNQMKRKIAAVLCMAMMGSCMPFGALAEAITPPAQEAEAIAPQYTKILASAEVDGNTITVYASGMSSPVICVTLDGELTQNMNGNRHTFTDVADGEHTVQVRYNAPDAASFASDMVTVTVNAAPPAAESAIEAVEPVVEVIEPVAEIIEVPDAAAEPVQQAELMTLEIAPIIGGAMPEIQTETIVLENVEQADPPKAEPDQPEAVIEKAPVELIVPESAESSAAPAVSVEAITPVEGIEKRFVVGLQWHPERIQDQPPQEKIFQAFIQSV